ncbi:MAG: STAS domain-containing protein [Phycisphaerales bacterium]|nr:STAS domain-containing protein [Phycisphaerales bacterium]MCB9856932.1 STAS domain-containing protein [Phycisphaerales bacterium]MCB9861941.1 STAS domain-containing protein [Phycisphaerales bacterium]
MSHDAHIAVAELPMQKTLLIRCGGRCTMGVCPAIRATISDRSTNPLEHIYIDLSGTESIDSTFTGFLLALRRGKATPDAPALHLVAPAPNVLRSLELMQVRRLMDIVDAMPAEDVEWTALAAEPLDAAQSGELVIDAHEELIEADERNRAKFGHVVELFRKDLEDKHGADEPS